MTQPRTAISLLINTYKLNRPDLRKTDAESILSALAEPQRIANEFSDRDETISKDPRLTGEGRRDAVTTAGREALAALDKWCTRFVGLDANKAQVIAELSAIAARPRPTEPAIALSEALVRAEIRRAAATMTDEEAESLFRTGDAQVRAALQQAPHITVRNGSVRVRPFVSDATRDAVLLEAAGKTRPDLADSLHDIQVTRDLYASTATAVRRAILDRVPDAEYPAAPPAIPPSIKILACAGAGRGAQPEASVRDAEGITPETSPDIALA